MDKAAATFSRIALLDGVTESNLHREVDTGPAQGSEAW